MRVRSLADALTVDLRAVRRHHRLIAAARPAARRRRWRARTGTRRCIRLRMQLDPRDEDGADRRAADGVDRQSSGPASLPGRTMPKPTSFRDRPEYSQSNRKVRRSFEITFLPTMVCSSPVTVGSEVLRVDFHRLDGEELRDARPALLVDDLQQVGLDAALRLGRRRSRGPEFIQYSRFCGRAVERQDGGVAGDQLEILARDAGAGDRHRRLQDRLQHDLAIARIAESKEEQRDSAGEHGRDNAEEVALRRTRWLCAWLYEKSMLAHHQSEV